MPPLPEDPGVAARPKHADRRKEPRLLCAELVTVYWRDETGNQRKTIANLEDVSHGGASLLMDLPIAPESEIRIDTGSGQHLGNIRYSTPFAASFLLGVQFLPGCEWDPSRFQPAHLFDPRSLQPAGELPDPDKAAAGDEAAPSTSDLQRLLDALRSDLAR